jgi:hypothetical protein
MSAALLELVSRGKQDAYFIQGARRTWFGTNYERRSPTANDIRIQQTTGPVQFGHWFDVELPRAGDILMSADLRIQLPTWLPPEVAALNRTHKIEIESRERPGTFVRYGWTNGIANYMIKRWALFADNVMLLEGWGDFNAWFPDMECTQLHAPIIHYASGIHDGSDRQIQRHATLPELVFRVPMIGCQRLDDVGFPLCALKGQHYFLRFWLADKTELVESTKLDVSAGLPIYEYCPAPWGGRRIRINGVLSPYVTLQEWELGRPQIHGRFAVLECDAELREALRHKEHQILFKKQQRETFVVEDKDWNPNARFKKELEIHGFFQALFLGFISKARLKQNKYRDINPPGGGDWLIDLGLIVNATERIHFWPPKKFQELANNTQLRRDVEVDLYYLIFGTNPEDEPAGTCNLSRTQKVLLVLQLEDVPRDPAEDTNLAYAAIQGLSWNLFEIKDGLGALKFPD